MRIVRNVLEFLVLFALWGALLLAIYGRWISNSGLAALIVCIAWGKTAFFCTENLRELWQASHQNIAYHRFMLLMLMNMAQIISSFALDFHCLHEIDPASFGTVAGIKSEPKLVFEFFYFSVLNFTFFGYGDVTPQTVPAKLLTMTEILLAFVTVIFLLSDFISLKESIRGRPNEARDEHR